MFGSQVREGAQGVDLWSPASPSKRGPASAPPTPPATPSPTSAPQDLAGRQSKPAASELGLACETCHVTFKNVSGLREHSKSAHAEVVCPVCGKKFTGIVCGNSATRRLTLHLPNCKLRSVRHKCCGQGCGQGFRTRVELKIHEKQCDKPKLFKCRYCDFTHEDKSALGRHRNKKCSNNPKAR